MKRWEHFSDRRDCPPTVSRLSSGQGGHKGRADQRLFSRSTDADSVRTLREMPVGAGLVATSVAQQPTSGERSALLDRARAGDFGVDTVRRVRDPLGDALGEALLTAANADAYRVFDRLFV